MSGDGPDVTDEGHGPLSSSDEWMAAGVALLVVGSGGYLILNHAPAEPTWLKPGLMVVLFALAVWIYSASEEEVD